MSKKLVYILPEYGTHESSRYYYIWEFLEKLSENYDILLFVEKPQVYLPGQKFSVYYQKFSQVPLNLFERFVVFSYFRLKGYRLFYIHYSIFSSLIASMVSCITGGMTFYWNCQMRSLYRHSWWENLAFFLNLKIINYLVTGNEPMEEYYFQTYNIPNQKIIVIPSWVNLKRFSLNKSTREKIRNRLKVSGRKVILFVHWLSTRKGADLIVPVAKEVLSKYPKSVFLIVGDGPLYVDIQEKIRRQNLEQNIRLIGHVGHIAIRDYYAAADVFFMPSKEEEFPRVVLEAMAAGLPIVATDTIGPRNLLTGEQLKFLVDRNDRPNFAEKLVEILKNSRLSSKLGGLGLKEVKKYDLSVTVENFIQLLAHD